MSPQSAADASALPAPAYGIFTRQLVWDEALAFLSFLRAAVPWGLRRRAVFRVGAALRRTLGAAFFMMWHRLKCVVAGRDAASAASAVQGTAPAKLSEAAVGQATRGTAAPPCSSCGVSPAVHPVVLSPCAHVHCYYCVAAKVVGSGVHLPEVLPPDSQRNGCLGREDDVCEAGECSPGLWECPLCSASVDCAAMCQ